MAKIILSEIAQTGVKGARKIKPKMNDRYKEVMREADERIQEDHVRSAAVYKKAAAYMARY